MRETSQASSSLLRNPDPDQLRAARAWAKAYNSFDMSDLEPLIAQNVRYSSMWVFDEIVGRTDYLDYLRGKLAAIQDSRSLLSAEIAETRAYPMYEMPEQPCVYVRQESGDKISEGVVLFVTESGLVTNISMTAIPIPATVFRTGETPR